MLPEISTSSNLECHDLDRSFNGFRFEQSAKRQSSSIDLRTSANASCVSTRPDVPDATQAANESVLQDTFFLLKATTPELTHAATEYPLMSFAVP
jgi:hypothetical protein